MEGAIDEAAVRRVWEEVLGADLPGHDPSFFEAGGDSVSALSVIFRVEEDFNLGVDIGDLFEAPQLSAFTRRLKLLAGQS
jgi:acyl carrier protein